MFRFIWLNLSFFREKKRFYLSKNQSVSDVFKILLGRLFRSYGYFGPIHYSFTIHCRYLLCTSMIVLQGEVASALVQQCREEGNWVCLQNCHLAHNYMRTLENLCDSVTLHNTSMEFRLFLTCAPTSKVTHISFLSKYVRVGRFVYYTFLSVNK